MVMNFANIEKMYEDFHKELLEEDNLRPCKSVTRDAEATVNKFSSYYKQTHKTDIDNSDVMSICDTDTINDTTNTNVRVMREFGFLTVLSSGRYELTDDFLNYVETNDNPGTYILEMMYKINGMDSLTMYSNLILCTLREGYRYGKILLFPQSEAEFVEKVPLLDERYQYRKRVYEIYGFSGRNKTPEDDEYTPNANYRVITELRNLNLIKEETEENSIASYALTSNAIHLLRVIDSNIRNRNCKKEYAENHDFINRVIEEREKMFKDWMATEAKPDGEHYSDQSISGYAYALRKAASEIDGFDYVSSNLFYYTSSSQIQEITSFISKANNYSEINRKYGNGQLAAGLLKYKEFLVKVSESNVGIEIKNTYVPVNYITNIKIDKNRNWIIFGAPGTGKSFKLKEECEEIINNTHGTYERVTFHPDYSYAQFVGTYKPQMDEDGTNIRYEYVPGPFMRVYVKALRNGRTDNPKPHLLIIEEINRANVAAVFGEVFQLLDRDNNNVSEYPIQASEDIKRYLANELGGDPIDYETIRIPNNMFIWATMNSADQGVFPMDTAFKRRWDFTYIGIDDNDKDIRDKYVLLGEPPHRQKVYWNKLRKAINKFLSDNKINEDKQLGPYFLPRDLVVRGDGDAIDSDGFRDAFKNKVLMYLFEDAAKQRRETLFAGTPTFFNMYSKLCEQFDKAGIAIFNEEIRNGAEPEDPGANTSEVETTAEVIQ